MQDTNDTLGGAPQRPLAGLSGWIITDGKAGMNVQACGVADALGLDYKMKIVAPSGVWRMASPWGPVAPSERFGAAGTLFAPPWPAVAIATGRLSIPYLRALRKKAGPQTFTVVLQDPKAGTGIADLIWVPAHDRLRGANVMTTETSPHSFTQTRLTALRASVPADIAALPKPRIAVILGGKNAVYKYRDEDDDRFEKALQSLAALGASFMITPSRRTHDRLLRKVEAATRDHPRVLWDGTGANPYPDFLAHADVLIVTADSVNMTGEACASGKPVLVFTPSGGSAKFDRFHETLRSYGATRPLPEQLDEIPSWVYKPLNSAAVIAREIEQRWARRKTMLAGLMSR